MLPARLKVLGPTNLGPKLTLTLALGLATMPLYADIYSYVDSDGVRHITNDPRGDTRYQRVMATPQYQRPPQPPTASSEAPPETVLTAAAAANGIVTTSTGGWQLITPRSGRATISRSPILDNGSVRGGVPFRVNETNRRLYAPHITRIAARHGVDPHLVHAVISAESAFNPKAVSSAGAMGLMQLMPATADRFGVSDAFDPIANIDGGVRYLRWLLNRFNNDLNLVLAGYNAGENAVIRHGNQIPPYAETQTYVPRVIRFYNHYRQQALAGG